MWYRLCNAPPRSSARGGAPFPGATVTDEHDHLQRDHHDITEETTTVQIFSEPTRFDVHRTDFDEPTAPHKRLPYVSPPRAHTHGAAASTPADPREVAGLIN